MGKIPAPWRAAHGVGASLAATLLAALASQHHLLHMLLLASGAGGAGLGSLASSPELRRAMLLLSLAMLGLTVYRALRRPPPPIGRLLLGLSVVTTLGFVVWSVARFGL